MSNSTNVETNVVQMRFDNKNFEKNVSQTMDSLDKLKKELKFDDSAKSFKTLEENAKKVDFSPLSKGIEKVQVAFSFLDTFSATVYHRLSNRLINIGKKVTSAVSTEGIRSGFSEYELKMNSFKTIQASAGKDFTDSKINEYLEELNRYADRTIYSFSDMTNNIGKFTNAGVKLDVAVKAIQGISNEAAVSGANAEQASHAMYNFSQALSAGYVKLTDWKSIEIANMATEEFKNELIKTAASVGTLTKAQNGMYKTQKGKLLNSTRGFNEALQDQWMTTDVLTKTLERYANETTDIGKKAFDAAQKVNTFSKLMDTLKESIQSGWSQTWELLIGNLKEATELYTAISNKISAVIDNFFKEKKLMIETWKDQHGRERVLQAMVTILKNFGDVLHAIRAAWRDIFPKKTANDLLALTVSFENFAKKTKPSREMLIKIRDTFKGVFAAISIVLNALKAFKDTFGKFFVRILGDALHALFGVTGSLGDMLAQVRKSVIENKTFYKAFQSIVNVLEWVYGGIKKVAGVIWDLAKAVSGLIKDNGGFTAIKNWFSGLFDAIKNFSITGIASHIASMFKNLWKIIDGVLAKTFDFYTPMKNKLNEFKNKLVNSKFAQWIVGFYQKIVDGVQKVFNSFREVKTDGVDELNEKTKSKFSVFEKIAGFFKKVWSVIKKVAETIWPLIKGVFNSLKTGIQMLWTGVTENIKNSDLGDAGGLLAGAGIMGLLLGIKNFIKSMTPMFKAITSIGNGFSGAMKGLFNVLENASKLIKAKILKEIAISILILTASIFVLCTLPKDKIVAATAAIGVLFQGMTSVFKAIDGLSSDMDENGDPKAAAKKGASGAGRLAGAAAMILSLAIAMAVLTIAMKKISSLSTEDITKGMIALGILFKMIESTINGMLEMGQRTRGSKSGDINIAVSGVASMIKALGKAMIYIMAAVAILALVMKKAGVGYTVGAIVLITFVLTVVGKIMKEIMKYTKQSESWATAISGFATMFAIGFIIKEFAAALVIIVGAIAILGFLVSKKIIGISGLLVAIRTIAVVITVLFAGIFGMVKLAETTEFANVGKVALLVGMVTLFVTAIANMILILSMLPGSWAFTGSSVILAVAAAISAIMLSLAYLLKQYELSYIDVKAVTTILGSITIAIVAVAAAIAAMSYGLGSNSNVEGMILLILAIAAAISGLVLAIGKFNTIARGIKVFTNALAAVAIAAAGFALAAFLIVEIISKMSKMTDTEIENIGKNFEKFINVISGSLDKILSLVLTFVKETVAAVITTLLSTILATAGDIIDGLIKLCDILMVKSPVLVYKIINTLAAILAEVEKNMGPLVTQVVTFIAQLISDVAKAINENAEKIVNAINDIITAITTLVVGSVAKMLGLDEFKGAVNALIKIIKPFTAYFLAMFAISKFKKNVSIVTKLLNTVKTRIGLLVKTTKTSGLAAGWKEFLGIRQLNEDWTLAKTAYKEGWASLGEATKVGGAALLKAAGVGAGIGLALGSIVKAFIDAKREALDATTSWAEDTDKELKELNDDIENNAKEISEARKKNKEDIKDVNKEYDTQEELLKRLAKIYDPKTGKVLEGHEEEAKSIADKINDALGVRLELEGNLLKMIDEQGQKRKVDLDTLNEINEKERLKATLDKNKELIESYKGEGGLLQTTREKKEKAEKKLTQYEDMLKLVEKYEGITNFRFSGRGLTDAEMEVAKDLKTIYQDSDLSEDEIINDIKSVISFQKMQVTSAEQNIRKMEQEIERYEEGINAAINGTAEQIHKVNMKYLSGYVEKGTGTTYDMSVALKKQMDMLKSMSLNPGDYDKTQMKQYLEGMMKQMTDLGYNKDTKIEGGYKITLKNQFGADEIKNFDTYGDLYAYYLEAFSNMPELMTEEVANGIEAASKDSKINSAVNSFSDSLKEGTTSSFKNGLSENAKGVLSNYISNKDNANGVLGFLRADADVNSPSKLYAKEIGEPLGEGIITGLSNYIDEAMLDGSVDGLMEKLQSSIFPAIASLTGNSIPFGGVTPVNFGLNQNGSGIYETDLPINEALPYDTHLMNITAILQKHSDNMMNQTNTIIEELGLLRGDVGSLTEHIDSIELRLDGNELVGGITAKMNSSLLRYSNRVGRRQ